MGTAWPCSERRRRDMRDLDETVQDTRARWDERLQRIEEWKKSVQQFQAEETHLQNLIRASVWLQKARHYQQAFTDRLERRAGLLAARYQVVHVQLYEWLMALQEHEASLQELVFKEESTARPFFVSRSRKQPEVEFVLQQAAVSDSLGVEIQALRRLLNHLRDQLRKALKAIEQRASGAEIFYEIHKQEILSSLKGTESILEMRREEVLSEALVYEGGRHLLRRLQGIVQNLRCLEDIPQPERLKDVLPPSRATAAVIHPEPENKPV